MADALTEILRAASKHPNSRVSKLIYTVEEEPTQKNIVLLLIELAEHTEYSTDFNISLNYYLDLFERLGINRDLVLNEAGLLLVNSSKVYSKRVDYVQSLVERQILTLSNADDELQKKKLEEQQTEKAVAVEKPKRGRKRTLEAPSDPYEVELVPKKFKKLTADKRFVVSKTTLKVKSRVQNNEMEQCIHPAAWQHATIYDLENEEDVDTKRNYKLFTYHVEHRHNTLVPDINFRLHFKVKDYIDEQEEMEEDEACNTDHSWPPLSEAYVQKYLRLENYVLQQDQKGNKCKIHEPEDRTQDLTEKQIVKIPQENLNTSNVSNKDVSQLEQSMLYSCAAITSENIEACSSNEIQESLRSLNINGNNDSGLGQSILDETNNTLENVRVSGSFETSITAENVNDSKLPEANKSLNATERDLKMETSLLNESGSTEIIENLNTTTDKESVNGLNVTDALNVTESQKENDSYLGNSVLNQESINENNTTTEPSVNMETTQESVCETTAETSEILDATIKESGDLESSQCFIGNVSKASENRIDSTLSDDHHISREDLNKIDEENGINLKIDLVQQLDKNSTQLAVNLPYADDEGVYLSDLEEHDCRFLSPIVKAPNILPGVERKDITIIMDDELRQALEMRDGIMEHFGPETYRVPVITEPKKQNLIFNILKLPEKVLRRKVLFKLGPDMDLYLKARSLRRCRTAPNVHPNCNTQLQQWFSLNNTDMADVCMTPPNSPDHCSVFCGFSDIEDDTISCAEFFGFTEEELHTLKMKNRSRLSRDSGVGVDVNNLTTEKDTLDILFDDEGNLEVGETRSTESILNQLPAEIRDILTAELKEYSEKIITAVEPVTENNSQTEELGTQTNKESLENVPVENSATDNSVALMSTNSSEQSELLCTESSIENSEHITTEIHTQESKAVPTENSIDSFKEQSVLQNSEDVPNTQSQDKSSNIEFGIEALKKITDLNTDDIEISSDEPSSDRKQTFKCQEKPLEEKINLANNTEGAEANDSDDDVMLDLDTQGNKTKIQQWHEYLQPILAKSRERHHFDVYKLGTEIIETVKSRRNSNEESLNESISNPASSNNPSASFHDIMDSKDNSYVSRYFLSTLLLANQSNIEISTSNKSSEKPSSWHDINLKLISTKRHTVAIEDNIGMIDKKQNARKEHAEQNVKEIRNNVTNNHRDNNEEEHDTAEDKPLIKMQNIRKSPKKLKASLKRGCDNGRTSKIVEKKPKEIISPASITNSRLKELPNLIPNVEIITTHSAKTLSAMNMSVMPSTSRQVKKLNTDLFNANANTIRTLQPVEKVQKRCDDHDSGIFSIDEMSAS